MEGDYVFFEGLKKDTLKEVAPELSLKELGGILKSGWMQLKWSGLNVLLTQPPFFGWVSKREQHEERQRVWVRREMKEDGSSSSSLLNELLMWAQA